MHTYGISNSSATFSPNLASLGRMVQEILFKIDEIIKNTKVVLFKLVTVHAWSLQGGTGILEQYLVQACNKAG